MAADTAPLAAVETPVAAAPETPVVTTPETPAVTAPAKSSDPTDFIRQAVSKALPLDAEGNISKPADKPATPPVAKAEPEVVKPAETPAETPEAKAEREKLEAAKPAEPPAEVDPLDKIGPLPAEKLAAALTENPELEAALTKAGIDKDTLFQTARDAAMTSQFTEIFPTVDSAKFAQESAGHFYQIEESFPSIQTVDDLDKFVMDTMLPLSIINGPDGKPLTNADGTFKTDGSVSRFLKLGTDYDMGMSSNLADKILASANTLPEGEAKTAQVEYAQNLKAAIDYIQDFRNNGYRMPGPKPVNSAVSPEVQQRLDRADQIERESNERNAENARKEEELFDNNVFDDTMKVADSLISEALNRSSLPDNLKEKAAGEIQSAIGNSMKSNKEYQRMSASYRAKGLNDETRKALAAHNTRTIRGLYGKIVEKVLGEYGATQIAASAARQQKIATQVEKDRSHPSSASAAPGKGPALLTDADIRKQAYENAKKANGGKEPEFNDVLNEQLALRGKRLTA